MHRHLVAPGAVSGPSAVVLPIALRGDSPGRPTIPVSDPLDAFFSLAAVHRIRIEIDAAGIASLLDRPRTYVHASVRIDDTAHADAGVRLKGGPGSFVPLDGDYPPVSRSGNGRPGKSAFIVDFDRYQDGANHLGLGKLTLNNLVQDPSGIHEHVGYALFRAVGVPASRTGFAVVLLNGQDKGLYAVLESPDNDVFLNRWFGSDKGNLYEGGGGADLRPGAIDAFDQDNGRDESRRDLREVAAALDAIGDGEDPLRVLAAHLDLDRYLRYAATEMVLGHWDGYVWSTNNFFVHHGEADGPWTFLPWGIDQLFEDPLGPYAGVMRRPGPAWVPGPGGRVHELCFASAGCRRELAAALESVSRTVDHIDLVGLATAARRVVEPYVLAEAEAFGDPALTVRSLDQVVRYLEDHRRAIEDWSPCLVDAVVDHDGDGYDGCTVDCADHEPDVHPGAVERCNLRDDDCNGRIDDPDRCPKCVDVTGADGARCGLCFEARAWDAARTFCRARGQDLASVHDGETADFLGLAFMERLGVGRFWIGLNDRVREGVFTWPDGSPVDFIRWAPESPRPDGADVDCVVSEERGWVDTVCDSPYAFACR